LTLHLLVFIIIVVYYYLLLTEKLCAFERVEHYAWVVGSLLVWFKTTYSKLSPKRALQPRKFQLIGMS